MPGLGGATGGGLFTQQQTGLGGVGSTGLFAGQQQKLGGGLFGPTSTQQGGLVGGGLFGGQTTQAGGGLFGGGQRPGMLFSQTGNTSTGLGLGGTQVQVALAFSLSLVFWLCVHAVQRVRGVASLTVSLCCSWGEEEGCSTSRLLWEMLDWELEASVPWEPDLEVSSI